MPALIRERVFLLEIRGLGAKATRGIPSPGPAVAGPASPNGRGGNMNVQIFRKSPIGSLLALGLLVTSAIALGMAYIHSF